MPSSRCASVTRAPPASGGACASSFLFALEARFEQRPGALGQRLFKVQIGRVEGGHCGAAHQLRGHPRDEDRHLARLLDIVVRAGRSEEHTSELQSLMRTSYALFCLTKKTNTSHTITNTSYTTTKNN